MNIQTFTNLLNNAEHINTERLLDLEKITKKYPYFQSAKAIYLKGLKQHNNFKYNKTLKATAAITVDRSVLFDYITDFQFTTVHKTEISNSEKNTKPNREDYSKLSEIEEKLEIGKPLDFQKNESHSFNEWLLLSKVKPISRKKESKEATTLFKNKDLIDRFIEQNPSINPLNKETPKTTTHQNLFTESELMTETLAKVYLEQKKYSNAIKAYQILILKYPEKSGFFADQINKIEHLKNK